jgi:hypothetical protein
MTRFPEMRDLVENIIIGHCTDHDRALDVFEANDWPTK